MDSFRIRIWLLLLLLRTGLTFCSSTDSSRISIFYRAGRDISKLTPKIENYSNLSFSQGLKNDLSKSNFINLSLGLVYQNKNSWGYGVVYSNVFLSEMNYNPEVYFLNENPNYMGLGSSWLRELNLTLHLFSGRVEHSFQKKCFYATPYFEAGIGKINFPQFRYLVKKEDENQFVEVGSILESGNHFVLNLGAEVGVRFIENLFFFSASPGLAYYRIAWNQTDYRTTLSTNTIDDPKKYSSQQTRFIFTIALGARLPLTKEFFNKIF